MQNAKCKMRMWIGDDIANRCSHWCGNLQVLPRTSVQRMSLRTSAHTGVAIRFPKPSPEKSGAPRSELKSNNCQWQLLHNVKVARASPASARRMRATCLSPWERCPAGVERACLPSQSLRDSSPRVGAKGRTDCDRRESLERATPVCVTLRYDCHWQSLRF